VPIALLDRAKLRQLCDSRLEEARVLLENKLWTGAYYFAGLAVECALKAYLASTVRQYDFPDTKFVERMYVHKLEQLFTLDGALWEQLQADMSSDPKLSANWSAVKDWDDGKRYDIVEELIARSLYNATTEAKSGVVE
jgi:HEPN domain-containing protein